MKIRLGGKFLADNLKTSSPQAAIGHPLLGPGTQVGGAVRMDLWSTEEAKRGANHGIHYSCRTRLDGRVLSVDDVVKVARPASGFQAEELGLTLEEGKVVLHEVQKLVAAQQAFTLSVAERICTHCGRRKSIKDARTKRLRSVFGELKLRSHRFNACRCLGQQRRVEWPLSRFREQTLPELRYLIGRLAADMPYRQCAKLLSTFLPMPAGSIYHASVRRHVLAIGDDIEARVRNPDEYEWLGPRRARIAAAGRVTIAMDRTYVKHRSGRFLGDLTIDAGRIDCDGKLVGRFAWPSCEPDIAIDFLKSALQNQGWTKRSRVAVLVDGADELGGVVEAAIGQAPRTILDWFHIGMRLRTIEQMTAALVAKLPESEFTEQLDSLTRWRVQPASRTPARLSVLVEYTRRAFMPRLARVTKKAPD